MARTQLSPRLPNGRFIRVICDDPNCDGTLQPDVSYRRSIWACDGLTHDTPDGTLRACGRTFDRLAAE